MLWNKPLEAGIRSAMQVALVAAVLLAAAPYAQAQVPSNAYSYSRTSSFTYVAAGSAQAGMLQSETVEPGNPNLCVTTTYSYDGYGNRTGATTSKCSGVSAAASFDTRGSSTTYDTAGRFPIQATNALSQSETHTFDPRLGAMTSLTGPNGLTTNWTLDAFGRKTKELRADGTSTVSAYCIVGAGLDPSSNSKTKTDGTGDPLDCPSVGVPGSGEVPADAVSFIHTEPHNSSGAKMGAFVRVYSDRLGRQIRSVTESFDGTAQPSAYQAKLIVSDTLYDQYGAKSVQTQPYFLTTGSSTLAGSHDVGASAMTYDALGRLLSVYTTDPNGSTTYDFGAYGEARKASVQSVSYVGLTTKTTNDHEQTRFEEKNAIGELIRVTDNNGAQIAYQRDAFGNLLTTKDALQNTITITYDIRGHKLTQVDPDAGTTTYTYDALGQLKSQQSPKQAVASTPTSFGYDLLGRMTTRVEPGDYTSHWYYDRYANDAPGTSSCNKGAGKLCESTTDAGVDHKYVYDALGRPLNSRTDTGTGPSFATALSYDTATGRVLTQTYPTGLQVSYGYTGLGFLQQVNLVTAATLTPLPATGGNGGMATGQSTVSLAANSLLWQAQSVDAWGKLEQQKYGNGIITNAAFEATQGRLTTLSAGPSVGSATVVSQSYVWDSLGNLTGRGDNIGDTVSGASTSAVTESFTYDALNRLTSYIVGASQIPGASRTVSLQYNALGMLLYKSDVGNYAYNAQGGAHPHALQSVSGGLSTSYQYDANGNLATATGTKYTSLSYTSFNLPDSQVGIKGPASSPSYTWQYDENHQRIREIRANASGTRIIWYQHPDNQGGLGFESETEVNATTSNRHFITAGGQVIGVLVSTGSLPVLGTTQTAPPTLASITLVKVEYWHKDHLGSLIATTDHTGAVTERYAYDPFGKRRYVNGNYDAAGNLQLDWSYTANWGAGRGFTGHEQMDDIGLVHMNGRIFDPNLGVFLQVDPMIQDPFNLQNHNRYAYCYNSPLTCTDPSGYLSLFGHHILPGLFNNRTLRLGVAVVAAYFTAGATWEYLAFEAEAGATGSLLGAAAAGGFVSGAIESGTLKGAIQGAITAAAFDVAGDYINSPTHEWGEKSWQAVAIHGVVGCITSAAGGTKCSTGALSASFSQAMTSYGPQSLNRADAASIAAHMIIGGSASALGGGKFVNGAETAAFGYLFNCLDHPDACTREDVPKLQNAFAACNPLNVDCVRPLYGMLAQAGVEVPNYTQPVSDFFSLTIPTGITAGLFAPSALVFDTSSFTIWTGYIGFDADGIVRYVGITSRDAAERWAEHNLDLAKQGLQWIVNDSATFATKLGARIWEQGEINAYGLMKNGGTLLNKINSIAPKYWNLYGL